MINPETINPSVLPSVPLDQRSLLPVKPCIYFAIDSQGAVQYIGKSINPKRRWRSHHSQRHLETLGGVKIAYLECPEGLLTEVEAALINWFCPPLNGGKTSYAAPFQIDVVRQIRVTVPDLEKRIRELRESSGKSAQSLATEAGISTAYWYQIEKGERQYITEEVLRGIERALNADFGVSFQ